MSYQVSFEEKSRCPVFFSRYLNFCFYKDIGTRCSRTDDIASFFNHQRLADDIIKTEFLNRNTKLDAGAIPYICTTSSETIVPVFVISSTASSVISASSQSRRSSIDSDESQKGVVLSLFILFYSPLIHL